MKRRFKYVNQWVTKTGITYVKFRRPGFPSIDLRSPVGSAEFMADYYGALAATGSAYEQAVQQLAQYFAREGDAIQAGVYLLFWRWKLVWVGSSHNMRERVSSHRRNGRPFDQAFYIPASDEDRLLLEKVLIQAFNPQQNERWVTNFSSPKNGGPNLLTDQ